MIPYGISDALTLFDVSGSMSSTMMRDPNMRAPNGMWMDTVGTLSGPWHVSSTRGGFYRDDRGNLRDRNVWCIVNMLDGKSKKIGPIKMKGTNYFDRAKDVAAERNDQFFRKHVDDLPTFLGMNAEFDKVIGLVLQKGIPEGETVQEAFKKWRGF